MNTENIEVIKESMVRCGWNEYIDSKDDTPNTSELQAIADHRKIERSQIEQWYMEGWKKAEEAAKEQGEALFLLRDLAKSLEHTMMNSHEWYGRDFESPLALVNKVIKVLQEEMKP